MLENNEKTVSEKLIPKCSSGKLTDLLEIVLITYNRHFFLEQTLSQLAESPFRDVKITIFDNHSQDQTPEVCARYREIFPNFSVIRHAKNIGGNANYLRAVEYLTYEYGWVLCDDDAFDFSDSAQVVQIIENCEYDVIYVASREELTTNPANARTALDILNSGDRLHHAFSFFPSIIFKTSLFDEFSLRNGYDLVYFLYPNFHFLNKLCACNATVFIPSRAIIIRNVINSSGFSGLFWYAAWINCAASIREDHIRAKVIHDATTRHGFFKSIAFWIAFERSHDPYLFWREVLTIFWGLTWQRRLVLLLLFPLMIIPIPRKLLLAFRRQVYSWIGVKDIPPVEVETRD